MRPTLDAALDLAYHAAVLEHDDRGHILDVEVLGELRSAVHVDAAAREALWLRRSCSTWSRNASTRRLRPDLGE